MSDNPPAVVPETRELSDSDYARQLGVEPRLKRALGFFTGSLFAVAFQGPTTGALLITGATLALGGPAFIWAIPLIFALQLLLALTARIRVLESIFELPGPSRPPSPLRS